MEQSLGGSGVGRAKKVRRRDDDSPDVGDMETDDGGSKVASFKDKLLGVNSLKQKGIQINEPREEFELKKVGMGITSQGLSEYKESLSGKNKHKAAVVEENQNPNIVVVEGERGGGSLALKFLYCVLASSVPPGSSSVKWGKSCDQNHITSRNKENEEVMVSTVELVDDISKKIDSFVGLIKDNINDSKERTLLT
ncbi:hypothetical protein Gohar_024676, partial [Gossypium harknessii]|nr:hypothetical protein [Gossypium harknessii]